MEFIQQIIVWLGLVSSSMFGAVTFAFPGAGGTGTTTLPTTNSILIGNASGVYDVKTLTGGSNVTITNSGGTVTIAASGSGGGGSGNVATSSAEASTYVPFWTSTAGTPALLSGGESTFAYNSTLNRLTIQNASSTDLTTTNATSTTLHTTRLGLNGVWFDDLVGDGLGLSGGTLIFDCADVIGTGLSCSGGNLILNATAGYAMDIASGIFDWDPTEVVGDNTFAAGGAAAITWCWNNSGTTDPCFTFGDDVISTPNNLTLSSGLLTITGTSDGCATFASGVLGSTGSACGSGGGLSAYDAWTHPSAGQSATTSTMILTTGGLVVNAASSTIIGNLNIIGNATSTNATSTNLYLSNELTVAPLTSALTLTGTTGKFAEYAGTSCTNQFVRSLSALGVATCATVIGTDVDLGDLTAGNSSLTLSGTYDGQTARTIVLNVGNANTWTAAQTFTVGVGVPGVISNSLVGIGTSTPKFSLQIASSTGPQLALSDGSLTTTPWTMRSINGNLYFATSSPSTFATSTDTRLFFDVNGKIGIGAVNTSPSKISFGSGTNLNINPNISPVFQDPSDSRFGACTSDDCIIMKSTAATLGIYGFDYAGGVPLNINFQEFAGTNSKIGISTSTPFAKLSVSGGSGTTYPIFQVASSSNTPYFTVHPTGTTTISGASAASSTPYIYSTAASKGGSIILEDTDGAGCTEVSALNGTLTAATVTCPSEI